MSRHGDSWSSAHATLATGLGVVCAAPALAALAAFAVFAVGERSAQAQDVERTPTAAEQLMIELVNRARLDPEGEAHRQRIDLNEGLAPGTLTGEAREPLAVNLLANQAALLHTVDLFANFANLPPDHRGSDGRDPTARVSDAGAAFFGGVAENNAWISQGSPKVTASSSKVLHRNLFRDFLPNGFEVKGRGHRLVMLNGARNEIGVALRGGKFGGRTASITTYDMFTGSGFFITGVAIADSVKSNDFYDIGEGLGGVEIAATARGTGARLTATTWKTGGYSLAVPPGTYDVVARGGGLPRELSFEGVVVSDRNVKLDVIVDKAFDPPPPAGITVTKAIAKQAKDGGWTLITKKTMVSLGTLGFDEADLPTLVVLIDGVRYFDTTSAANVKPKIDAALGQVRKVSVKDADGNKLKLDLKKSTFALKMKAMPGFDPSDGSVEIEIGVGADRVRVTVPGTPNTKGNKLKLGPADGVVVDD